MNVLEWPHSNPESLIPASDPGRFEDPEVVRRTSFTRQMWYDRKLPAELIANLWNDADRVIRKGEMLKDGDRSTVVLVRSASTWTSENCFVLKRYNLKGPLHTALHCSLRSRARNCWFFGRRLMVHGIASPAPRAFLEHRFGGFRTRSFLVTEFVQGTHLDDYLSEGRFSPRQLRILSEEFAELWCRLGVLHLGHGDMKASNFLVSRGNHLWLIDLDGMQTCNNRFAFWCSRRRDWKRFMKNWIESPEIELAFYNSVRQRMQDRLQAAA